ncbi:MAG: hypothetical protein IKN50_06340 [Clostridia bacterium]|nr:hypothetical protein [Clostridia bacterium]
MNYNLILSNNQIEGILLGHKLTIYDFFGEIELEISEKHTFSCFFYELYDHLKYFIESEKLNEYEFISYQHGFEHNIFSMSLIDDSCTLFFHKEKTVETIAKKDLLNLYEQIRCVLLKLLKLWYSDLEIGEIIDELM